MPVAHKFCPIKPWKRVTYVSADPRGTLKTAHSRGRVSHCSFAKSFNIIIFILLAWCFTPVNAIHFPSTAGIYYMRKSVEVELLVLTRIIHVTKSLILQDVRDTYDTNTAYVRLTRYIGLMSGVQVLIYQTMQSKTTCNC